MIRSVVKKTIKRRKQRVRAHKIRKRVEELISKVEIIKRDYPSFLSKFDACCEGVLLRDVVHSYGGHISADDFTRFLEKRYGDLLKIFAEIDLIEKEEELASYLINDDKLVREWAKRKINDMHK